MAEDTEHEEFIAMWRQEVRPAMQAAIRDLMPHMTVDGRPANASEAAYLLREIVSANFDRQLQEATPPGLKLTPQEKEDIRRVTLEVLSEEIRRHDQ